MRPESSGVQQTRPTVSDFKDAKQRLRAKGSGRCLEPTKENGPTQSLQKGMQPCQFVGTDTHVRL
jgi:hypothetical protein